MDEIEVKKTCIPYVHIWPNFENLKISAAPVTNFKSIFKLGG